MAIAGGAIVVVAALLILLEMRATADRDDDAWPPTMTGPVVAMVPSDSWLGRADSIHAMTMNLGGGMRDVQLSHDDGRANVVVTTIIGVADPDELVDSYGEQAVPRTIRGREGRVMQPNPSQNRLMYAWEEAPGVVVSVYFAVETSDLVGDAFAFADGLRPLDEAGWDQFVRRRDVSIAHTAEFIDPEPQESVGPEL